MSASSIQFLPTQFSKSVIAVALTVILTSCQSSPPKSSSNIYNFDQQAGIELAQTSDRQGLDVALSENAVGELVDELIVAIEQRDLKKASGLANVALKLDVTNPDLQFFNGLVYHLMGIAGDSSKFDLAEEGYKQALRNDPGNLSAQYQLGLLYMDQRRYQLAQGKFAAVAIHYSDDPSVLYNLSAASYYARDPQTAEGALSRLVEMSPKYLQNPDVVKALALSRAAMNDEVGARESVAQYEMISGMSSTDITALHRRVNNWLSFYQADAPFIANQFGSMVKTGYADDEVSEEYYAPSYESDYEESTEYSADESDYEDDSYVDQEMVVVDVVLIGTQEDARDATGINLLNGLQLQFGDPLSGTPAGRVERIQVRDDVFGEDGEKADVRTIIKSVSIPSVTYSLNIANSLNADNQVLAKPSLVALSGETSEFFSGTEILAAAVSGGDGDSVSVEKEVGVKLAITPEVLPKDMVRLHVVAERTFLTDPSNSVVFEFRLDTTKTNINSTVTMKYGETLILGGLSEREVSKVADGVPLLMDIPIVNLLFSEKVEREFERSILILITPRRPQYAYRSGEDREQVAERMNDVEKNIERLNRRHRDWFTPRPTFNQIIDEIQGNEFFEEFRIGDVKIEPWEDHIENMEHISLVRDRLLEI